MPRKYNLTVACTCIVCGKAFKITSSDANRGRGNYCGLACWYASDHRVPVSERFWEKVDTSGDCWIWTGARNQKGYGHVTVNGRMHHTQRIAWELTHGPIPDGLFALHHCDNPPCVRPEHIYLGTAADNARDKNIRGRNDAKLTPDQVRAIRVLASLGYNQLELATLFEVSHSNIGLIINRKTWQYIE